MINLDGVPPATISESGRKNKQLKAEFTKDGKKHTVHFGDPDMPEYPGTERGNNYCARSFGIKNKQGNRTARDPTSPNFWSRRILWNCKRKQSRR